MLTIKVRNVHQALPEAARLLLSNGVARGSRNGTVLALDEPLSTEYQKPTERVLFWPDRDANPFFHLFESLWMLAGRNDVAFLARFNQQMVSYSDDGARFVGAYGYRWRVHFQRDQLSSIASALIADPSCRRQVLTMWDPHVDLGNRGKDLPCNTHAYFQRAANGSLSMMVSNRSNDALWGAYGANAVHFSVLQEYLAARIGCSVGAYHQVSANTHVYLERHGVLLERLARLASDPPTPRRDPYSGGVVSPFPLIQTPIEVWERNLQLFVRQGSEFEFDDPFFAGIAAPMLRAHERWSEKGSAARFDSARRALEGCMPSDWRVACEQWVDRREAAALGGARKVDA